ncbi:MAG TPA: hypothetical protein VGA92_08350 [Candidatus Nitrosotenuis sp.]|jgi:hypothetical protein
MSIINHKANKFGAFVGVLVLILAILVLPFNSVEAKVDETMCKSMYERYKVLGEQKFREKYKNKSFLNDCIKLYKNPNWYFVGKSKIDKHYEKLNALMQNTTEEKKITVKILSSISIGADKYLVKFRACAEKSTIQKPSFLIKSQFEQYLGLSSKVLQVGKCNDYHAQIKTKQAANIQIEYVYDLSKYQNIKTKVI